MVLTMLLLLTAAPQAEPTLEESLGCALLAIAVRDDMAALGDAADEEQRAALALAVRIHAAAAASTRAIVQRDRLDRAATEAVRDRAQAGVFDQWERLDESLTACAAKLGLAQP